MLFVVDFSASGNSAAYRREGWSGQEREFVWTIGPESRMILPAIVARQDLILDVDLNPGQAADLLTAQPFAVRVNGVAVGAALLTGFSRVRIRVDRALIRPSEPIAVTFEHPGYARMDWLGRGSDVRLLGVSVFSVRLYTTELSAEVERLTPLIRPHQAVIEAAPPVVSLPVQTGPGSRAVYAFGADLPASVSLGEGWLTEAGVLWTAARVSRLTLPALADPRQHLLRIRLQPLQLYTIREDQRLSILLNGRMLGQFRIEQETVLGFPLPVDLPRDTPLTLTFVAPDAVRTDRFANGAKDQALGFALHEIGIEALAPQLAGILPVRTDRARPAAADAVAAAFLDEPLDELPAAIEARLGVSLTRILKDFESLGDNCGFGLAQRKGGVEVLGLLRFANTRLASLLHGLDDEFQATTVAEEATLIRDPGDDGEFMLRVPRYGIRWHTMVRSGEPDEVFAQQTVKLRYLRRKFYEGLQAGRKIYTVARAEPRKIDVVVPCWGSSDRYEIRPLPLDLAEAVCVLTALNRTTPNTLLYLVPSCDGRRSGTVERLAPGLLRGHLDSFVISDKVELRDHADWMRLVGNAWLLLNGARQDTAEETQVAAA